MIDWETLDDSTRDALTITAYVAVLDAMRSEPDLQEEYRGIMKVTNDLLDQIAEHAPNFLAAALAKIERVNGEGDAK